MKKLLIATAFTLMLAVIAGLVAIRSSAVGDTIRQSNRWSATVSLEEEIVSYVERYHKENERYPNSIDPSELDFSKTDQAVPEMLDRFVYISNGDSYSLRLQSGK